MIVESGSTISFPKVNRAVRRPQALVNSTECPSAESASGAEPSSQESSRVCNWPGGRHEHPIFPTWVAIRARPSRNMSRMAMPAPGDRRTMRSFPRRDTARKAHASFRRLPAANHTSSPEGAHARVVISPHPEDNVVFFPGGRAGRCPALRRAPGSRRLVQSAHT